MEKEIPNFEKSDPRYVNLKKNCNENYLYLLTAQKTEIQLIFKIP